MMQLTKSRFYLAAHGVQLHNGVTLLHGCALDPYYHIVINHYEMHILPIWRQQFGPQVETTTRT